MEINLDHVTSQVFWLIIAMVGFYTLASSYIIPKIVLLKNRREKMIDKNLSQAQKLSEQIERLEQDIKYLLFRAQNESTSIKNTAFSTAADMVKQSIFDANGHLTLMYKSEKTENEERKQMLEAKIPQITQDIEDLVREALLDSYRYDK